MPNAATHLIFGLVAALSLTYLYHEPSRDLLFLTITLVLYASVLPDIDHSQAASRRTIVLTSLLIFLANFFYLKFYSVSGMISPLNPWIMGILITTIALAIIRPFTHRGFTHSLSALGLFSGAIYMAFNSIWLTTVVAIGFYSHILLDFTITALKNLRTGRSVFSEFIKIIKPI